jgi:hypothetical protein
LASTPVVYFAFGCFHFACGAAISAFDTFSWISASSRRW